MENFKIRYLDYYLPKEKKSIVDIITEMDDSVVPPMFSSKKEYQDFTKLILDIQEVRVEEAKEDIEMLDTLMESMFLSLSVKPEDIDLLITTKETQQVSIENTVKYLQNKHKMKNARVMNISGNHCANIPAVWDILEGMNSGDVKNVVIVNGYKCKSVSDRILGAYGILSDGAGIMLLQKGEGVCSLLDTVSLSNGALFNVDMNKDNSLLHYKYMLTSLKKLLDRNQQHRELIKIIIPQNANILLLSNVVMEAGLDTRKIFTDNMSVCGHIDSLDFIINLKDILQNKSLKKGDKILILNMGWAGSYFSSLLSINE